MIVERISGTAAPIAKAIETWSAGIPIRDAIRGGVLYVEIASGLRGVLHHRANGPTTAIGREIAASQRLEEFELLREAAHCPREAPGPGRKWRIALLRIGAAVVAIP